jgi:peptidoglycan/LPS O-acetylase OafA/YrhL
MPKNPDDLRANTGRDNNFDAIRLAMALLVIFSHAYPLATGEQLFGWEMVSLGAFAVAVFFVVSGYLITMSWERSRSTSDFLRRRAVRILPGFIVAFALSAWVVGPLASDRPLGWFHPEMIGSNLVRLALLNHVEGDAFMTNPYPVKVNGSLWTIRFEFGCYFLVAFAGLAGFIRRKWCVAMLMAIVWALLIAWGSGNLNFKPSEMVNFVFGYFGTWLVYGTWFLSGAVAYAFRDHIRYHGGIAIVSAVLVMIPFYRQDVSYIYLWPLGLTYLAFWFAFSPQVRLHRIVPKLGGDYSYGLYLYAFPVQQICVKWLGCEGRPLVMFVIATALTTVLAVLSWRWIEHPWLAKKPHTVDGSRGADGSTSVVASTLEPSLQP